MDEQSRVVYTWGDTIHNPSGATVGPDIVAHEEVHEQQQNGDPSGWWHKYMGNIYFRLAEEARAYQVQYRTYCKHVKDRNEQARYLLQIAGHLSSNVYGNMITQAEAVKLIANG